MKRALTNSITITTLCISLFIILRIPSLFEPHWYGDEGVYASVSYAMENGKTLYTEVWDNKPPAIYYIYMVGNSQNRLLVVRLISILAGILTLAGLSFLALRLSLKPIAHLLTLLMGVFLLGSPVLEANIANGENFFLPFIVWGLLFGIGKKNWELFLCGILFGIGFWIKFHPLFDAMALGLWLLYMHRPWESKQIFYEYMSKVALLVSGFLVPILILIGYLVYHNSLTEGISTMYFNNVSYTRAFQQAFLSQEIRFTGLLLCIAIISFLYFKKKISSMTAFLYLLLLLECFATLLSGRRYKHYLLQLTPGLSLLFGYYIGRFTHIRRLIDGVKLIIITSLLCTVMYAGNFVFNLGEGYLLDTNPIKYYVTFSEYLQKKKPYFLSPADITISQTRATIKSRYAGSKIHLYVDNPWFYDALEIKPALSFIPAYHQTLRENGQKLYLTEFTRYDPDVIVYEKSSYTSDIFETYILEHYVHDFEDDTFVYYVRRGSQISQNVHSDIDL